MRQRRVHVIIRTELCARKNGVAEMNPLEWLFVIALVLYSLAIWSHKFEGKLRPWMVWVFGAGLLADIAGTVLLCVTAAEKWQFNLHAVSGFAALAIMALHFSWALFAIVSGGKFESYFNRFSVYAWCLWMVAFTSGMPGAI